MLQNFLFPNRKKDTIFDVIDDNHKIIDGDKKDFLKKGKQRKSLFINLNKNIYKHII